MTWSANEAGWKTFDDKDVNISYGSGVTQIESDNRFYEGDMAQLNVDSSTSWVKFNFTGDKIRIIGYPGVVLDENAMVNIDGVIYTFNATSPNTPQTVMFEKTNLEYKSHYVSINIHKGKYLSIDAIDIDETGELKPYNENVLPMYLIKNKTDIYSINPSLYKISEEPVTFEMFDKYGSEDLINLTKTLNESAILFDKVGVMGNGNEFEVQLTSEILSIKNVEVE